MSQNDTDAPDYIKNRTHWAEDPVVVTETTLDTMTMEFEAYEDGTPMEYTFECSSDILTDGAEVVVTWDGTEYNCVAENVNVEGVEYTMFGNPIIIGIEESPEDNGQPFAFAYIKGYGFAICVPNDTEAPVTHTVKIVTTLTTQEIHKLDNKYIDSEWLATRVEEHVDILSTSLTFNNSTNTSLETQADISTIGKPIKLYVIWDGTTYECECMAVYVGGIPVWLVGMDMKNFAPSGEYPFGLIIADGTLRAILPEAITATIPISISADVLAPVKIPAEFLPETGSDVSFTQTLTSGTKIGSITIDGASTDIYAPEMDSAPTENSTNLVTSGGVYTEVNSAKMTANMAMPGSLKWDGIVGDREYVVIIEEPMGEGVTMRMHLAHVSDYIPTMLFADIESIPTEERVLSVLCSMGGIETGGMHEVMEIPAQVADDMFIMGEIFVYIPTDGYSLEGITFPKKGWYFMSQSYIIDGVENPVVYCSGLHVEACNFPDTNGGGSDKYFEDVSVVAGIGDTLTWDGNTEGLVSFSNIFYKVSDSTPTLTELNSANVVYLSNGTSYSNVQFEEKDEGSYGADNPNGGVDMVVVVSESAAGDLFPESGTYFAVGTSSLTIPNYNFIGKTTKKVIKTEHLPEALRFGEINESTDTITWDGDTTNRVSVEVYNGIRVYKISDDVLAINEITDDLHFTEYNTDTGESREYTFADVKSFSTINTDGSAIINVLSWYIIPYDGYILSNVVFPEAGIYFFLSPNGMYVSSLTVPAHKFVTKTFKTIDPKYLPDDIGGGSGLPEVSADDNGKSLSVVDGEWAIKKQSYNDLEDKPELFSGSYNDLADKPELFSGSYNDLTDSPIPNASTATEGAFLRVVNGSWKAVILPNAEDGEF